MVQSAERQPGKQMPKEQQAEEQKPEPQTQLSIVDGQAPPLSLTALHSELTSREIQMPYSSLSQFVALGDIAEQLGVGGKGNRREFPRWAVDFLADFLPWYQSSKINKELASDAVRHRLVQFRTSDNSITRMEATGQNEISTSHNSKTPSDMTFYEPAQQSDIAGPAARFFAGLLSPLTRLPAAMDNVADAIRELRGDRNRIEDRSSAPAPSALPQDRLLTAEQAAELLACNPRSVNRHVKEVLPRKWKESDILTYIQQLEPKSRK